MNASARRIDTLDLGVVKRKLTMSPEAGGYGWPEKETEGAIKAYRAFLKQVLEYRTQGEYAVGEGEAQPGHGPSPDPVTDIVWHTHILFTEKYHHDCAALFGAYIHHRPRVDDESPDGHHPAGA